MDHILSSRQTAIQSQKGGIISNIHTRIVYLKNRILLYLDSEVSAGRHFLVFLRVS